MSDRPTLPARDATEAVKRVWEQLWDVMAAEEAWYILQKAMHSYKPACRKTCYLAGPMRGYENFNFPAFMENERLLRAAGWEVWNPARFDLEQDGFNPYVPATLATEESANKPLEHYVRRDVGLLASLRPKSEDAIVLMPGWTESTGATAEAQVSTWLKLRLLELEDALD
jgi:hypothetical protein